MKGIRDAVSQCGALKRGLLDQQAVLRPLMQIGAGLRLGNVLGCGWRPAPLVEVTAQQTDIRVCPLIARIGLAMLDPHQLCFSSCLQ